MQLLPLLLVTVRLAGGGLPAALAHDPALRVVSGDAAADVTVESNASGVWIRAAHAASSPGADGVSALPTPVNAGEAAAALAPDIDWTSAPALQRHTRLAFAAARLRVVARAGGDPLLVIGDGVAVLAADLDGNPALARWGFLPFALHAAILHAAGRPVGRFADWPLAPLPHHRLRLIYAGGVLAWALALAVGFAAARRRARAHPDAHVALFASLARPPGDPAWTRPGIARPLGGFFLFLSTTLLAIGPYLYLTAVLIPSHVQPFPDADGAWAPVDELGVLAWTLCDFGITTAFVQRFARCRVDDPAAALRSAQLYVWWQLFAGLALLALGGAIACGILPHTGYALWSRVVLLRALVAAPGLLGLFTVLFQALQRFDYQLGLDLLDRRLLAVLVPIPFVLAFRAWGRAHAVAVGEPFGAVIGLAVGQYAASAIACAVGLTLYRRLRLPVAPLLLAGFDRRTVAEMVRFGAGVVAGNAPFFIANAIEIGLVTSLLPGYPEWLGIRQLLQNRLIFTLYFLWPFIDSGIPAFAEALAAGKRALARYYVVRYLQVGHLFVAVVVALLLGAGRPLVALALAPAWRPVATFLPLAAATGLLLPTGWLADALQKGAGRTGLNAAIQIAEQAARLLLFYLLIPSLGFAGIFVAVLVAFAAKSLLAWWLNHRLILALEPHWWFSLGAPFAAGALVYALLAGLSRLLPATPPSAVALFGVAALLVFPLGFWFAGALGGLDAAMLDELAAAAELAGVMRPIARLLHHAARHGARRCPFAVATPPLAALANAEADQIRRVETERAE